MSWKSRLFYCSVFAFLSMSLTNQGFAQEAKAAAEKPVAGEQGSKAEPKLEAKEEPEQGDEDDLSQMTLDELTQDFKANMRAYSKRYRAAPNAAKKREVAKTIPKVARYQPRLIELINEEPGSKAGLDVVDWWWQRGGRSKDTDVLLGLLVKNYSKLETIEKYIPYFAWYLPDAEAEQHLRTLLEVNPADVVKANASFELHQLLRKQAKKLEGKSAEKVNAEIKTLHDSIYEHYADVTDSTGSMLVDRLDSIEFAKKLEIGEPVPDIVGVDIDGVDFKLSDYDGKVRVLSYWAHW